MNVRRIVWLVLILGGVLFSPAFSVRAEGPEEESLIGELVAIWSYGLRGPDGVGGINSSGQANLIGYGSPVAIRVGEDFYVIQEMDQALRGRLMNLAGRRVVAKGEVSRTNKSELTIKVSKIERARKGSR